MTAAQRRYVATEAAVGGAISAVLSVAFVLLVFGGSGAIAAADLAHDALPQGAAIAIMATLVPTLLTRRRARRGAVAPLAEASLRAVPLWLRAVVAALAGSSAGVALFALLPALGVVMLPHAMALAAKAGWGGILGGVVAGTMTRATLAERR